MILADWEEEPALLGAEELSKKVSRRFAPDLDSAESYLFSRARFRWIKHWKFSEPIAVRCHYLSIPNFYAVTAYPIAATEEAAKEVITKRKICGFAEEARLKFNEPEFAVVIYVSVKQEQRKKIPLAIFSYGRALEDDLELASSVSDREAKLRFTLRKGAQLGELYIYRFEGYGEQLKLHEHPIELSIRSYEQPNIISESKFSTRASINLRFNQYIASSLIKLQQVTSDTVAYEKKFIGTTVKNKTNLVFEWFFENVLFRLRMKQKWKNKRLESDKRLVDFVSFAAMLFSVVICLKIIGLFLDSNRLLFEYLPATLLFASSALGILALREASKFSPDS